MYYADLYPLISFLPRFSTHAELASEEDMLPLWKASDMDHEMHHTIRRETMTPMSSQPVSRSNSPPVSRSNTEPMPNLDDMSEKALRASPTLVPSTKRSKRKFDPEQALPVLPSEQPLRPSRNPPQSSLYNYFPFLLIFKGMYKRLMRATHHEPELPMRHRSFTGKKIRPEAVDSNVPTEIALFLTTYYAWIMRQGLLTPASATAMNNAIGALQDTVTNLERIKNTPLPFAYQAHLRASLWYVLHHIEVAVIQGADERVFCERYSGYTCSSCPYVFLASRQLRPPIRIF